MMDGQMRTWLNWRKNLGWLWESNKWSHPQNEGRASKRPKRNGRNPRLSSHETSDAPDPTLIGDPLSIQNPTPQDSGSTTARNVKARSIRRSAPKKKDKIRGRDTGEGGLGWKSTGNEEEGMKGWEI
jgi:hypothetical protein